MLLRWFGCQCQCHKCQPCAGWQSRCAHTAVHWQRPLGTGQFAGSWRYSVDGGRADFTLAYPAVVTTNVPFSLISRQPALVFTAVIEAAAALCPRQAWRKSRHLPVHPPPPTPTPFSPPPPPPPPPPPMSRTGVVLVLMAAENGECVWERERERGWMERKGRIKCGIPGSRRSMWSYSYLLYFRHDSDSLSIAQDSRQKGPYFLRLRYPVAGWGWGGGGGGAGHSSKPRWWQRVLKMLTLGAGSVSLVKPGSSTVQFSKYALGKAHFVRVPPHHSEVL